MNRLLLLVFTSLMMIAGVSSDGSDSEENQGGNPMPSTPTNPTFIPRDEPGDGKLIFEPFGLRHNAEVRIKPLGDRSTLKRPRSGRFGDNQSPAVVPSSSSSSGAANFPPSSVLDKTLLIGTNKYISEEYPLRGLDHTDFVIYERRLKELQRAYNETKHMTFPSMMKAPQERGRAEIEDYVTAIGFTVKFIDDFRYLYTVLLGWKRTISEYEDFLEGEERSPQATLSAEEIELALVLKDRKPELIKTLDDALNWLKSYAYKQYGWAFLRARLISVKQSQPMWSQQYDDVASKRHKSTQSKGDV
jgi:hypothetical protein